MGVAKTFPAGDIRAAYAAGVRHFGENRVQEWESKWPHLKDLDATWHLVGHLQSNKAARAVRIFHTIDSLDSLSLAQKLDRAVAGLPRQPATTSSGGGQSFSPDIPARPGAGASAAEGSVSSVPPMGAPSTASEGGVFRLPVLIEVRLAPQATKSGVDEAGLPALAEAVLALPHLDLRGLMCLPPYFEDPEQARPYFRRLRELRDALRRRFASLCHPESAAADEGSHRLETTQALLPELSMGMSHDFEVAIEEGATQVRLGTAIFGLRPE